MTADFVFRMLGATAAVFLSSATGVAENPMDCVEEITMPSVPMGMVTSLPATGEGRILIGVHGRAQKILYSNASAVATVIPFRLPVLKQELNTFFDDGPRYVEACKGKTISF